MIRIWKFLNGLQEIVESVTCNSVKRGRIMELESGGARIDLRYWVRWWAPATWLAWVRTVVFRDNSGCAFYRRGWRSEEAIRKRQPKDIVRPERDIPGPEARMVQSPRETCPQYNHELSKGLQRLEEQLAQRLEEQLAVAEHVVAVNNAYIRRLESDKAYWQEQAGVAGEELRAFQHSRAESRQDQSK